jgi:outer membrane protein
MTKRMESRFRTLARLLLTATAALLAPGASAEDLLQIFRDARGYDAQYGAARYALQAGLEKLPQGRSLILPTLGLTSGYVQTNLDIEGRGSNPAPSATRSFSTGSFQLPGPAG